MDAPKIEIDTLDRAFEEVSDEMLLMFLKKHRDYGKGNISSVGELGIALRISEKIERIKHLMAKGSDPANETIDETWVDIGVYAVLAILLRRGKWDSLSVDPSLME